jgi:antitoxin ParD1/3/4
MRSTQSLSITLPLEMVQMVKDKVASGEYATESEVIRDGLRTLAARDAAVEKWLREEVAPAYDAHKADPSHALPLDEAMARVRERNGRRDRSIRAAGPSSL